MRLLHLFAILTACTLVGCGGGDEADSTTVRVFRTSSSHLGGDSGVVESWGSVAIQHQGDPIDLRIWHIDDGKKKRIGTIALNSSVHRPAYLTPAINEEKGTVEFEAASFRDNGRSERPGSTEFVSFSIPTPVRFGCSLMSGRTRVVDKAYLFHYWIQEHSEADLKQPIHETHDAFMKISADTEVSFVLVDAVPSNRSEQADADQPIADAQLKVYVNVPS